MKRKDFLRISTGLPFILYSGIGCKNMSDTRLFPVAHAFPPRAERPYPSGVWLEAVKQAGYSHVILMNNPFHDFRLVDIWSFTTGPHAGRLQTWIEKMSEMVSQYNLKLSMILWEPRMPVPGPQSQLPPHWTRIEDPPKRWERWIIKINSVPEAREWMLNGFKMILEKAPSLDTFILGTNDNQVIWELESETNSPAILMAEFYRDLYNNCRQIRPSTIIPYSWNWDITYNEPIFSSLPAGTPIVTRIERGTMYTPDILHPEWSGIVQDMAMGPDTLGNEFEEALNMRKNYNTQLITMISLSGMFEGWDIPYIPAIGQMLSKFDKMREQKVTGWVDYDCGGIHEGLMTDLVKVVQSHPKASKQEWQRLIATNRYGEDAVSNAISAWNNFDHGIKAYPAVVGFPPPGRTEFNLIAFILGHVPMMPFFQELIFLADNYERLTAYSRDPHYWLHSDALPVFLTLIKKAVPFAEKGFQHYKNILQKTSLTETCRKNAQKDTDIAELAMLSWQSVENFFEWAAAVKGIDTERDLSGILQSEIGVTSRYRELALRPELQVGNMTWLTSGEIRNIANSVNPDNDTDRKNKGQDWYQWKIDHLRRQLP